MTWLEVAAELRRLADEIESSGRGSNEVDIKLRGGVESRHASLDPKVVEAAVMPHREGETLATASTGITRERVRQDPVDMVPQTKSGSDKGSVVRTAVPQAGIASGPRDYNCIGGKRTPAVEKPTKEPVAPAALPKGGTDLAKSGAALKPRAVSVQSAIDYSGRAPGPMRGVEIMADGMVIISTIEIKRLVAEAVEHCPVCAARRAADAARLKKV